MLVLLFTVSVVNVFIDDIKNYLAVQAFIRIRVTYRILYGINKQSTEVLQALLYCYFSTLTEIGAPLKTLSVIDCSLIDLFLQRNKLGLHVVQILDWFLDRGDPPDPRGDRRERPRLLHNSLHRGELCNSDRLHLHLQGKLNSDRFVKS